VKISIIGAMSACLAVVSSNVAAATITHGGLSTNDDGSTNIITDTLNNYEWLRFDVLAPLTYADTLAVLNTQDGGGWSIAGVNEANMFVSSLLSPSSNACSTASTANETCGFATGWLDGDFGADDGASNDYVFYMTGALVGQLRITQDLGGTNDGKVQAYNEWGTIADSDYFSGRLHPEISWLLYRDVATVPVPAAVWLFGSGLIGLIGVARRKES